MDVELDLTGKFALDYKGVCLDEIAPDQDKLIQSFLAARESGWRQYPLVARLEDPMLAMKQDVWPLFGIRY